MRMLGWGIAAAVTALVLTMSLNGASWQTPWRQLLVPFAIALLFTSSIVPLAAVTMPRVMPPVRRHVPFPLDWAVCFLVMIALGLAGSGIAIGVLWTVGYIPSDR